MKKAVFVIFLISSFVFSQEEITKNLGDFHTLKTYRGLVVELVRSDTPKSVVEGEKSEEVIIKNVNGVLKITLKTLESFSAERVKVTIYFKDDIQLIDANEGSKVKSEETFAQEKIELKTQEAGKIDLKLRTEQLIVKSVSGGFVELDGYSKNSDISVNTGGSYKGGNLETETTKVKSSTGSSAVIYASKSVDANANLGASITIIGNPEEINKKETLGGYVKD
jgi:hypothetical protein